MTKRETKWIVKPEEPREPENRADLSISKIFSAVQVLLLEAFCVGHKKLAKKKTPHTFELEQEMINAGYCDLKKNKVVKFAKNSLGSLKFASTFLT